MAEKKKVPAVKQEKKILVIVESPAKIRTLSGFLGSGYEVQSSKGHLIDLPKSSLGVDIGQGFEPRYITIRGKGKILGDLKKSAKKASAILLATDPDREGEAISWHLERVFEEVNSNIRRIEFNEITREAVQNALLHPREVNSLRVNSQQARRILDRLVGYSISPVLQTKFGSKRFSAGRVQSAALKIIADRENEIDAFVPKEFWEFDLPFNKEGGSAKDATALFRLASIDGNKADISSAVEAELLQKALSSATYVVSERKSTERKIMPPAPYITSRLQQDASTRLAFRAQKTMSVAQTLYEGVDIGSGQVVGLITYMRTDSTRISDAGLAMARGYIEKVYGKEHLPDEPQHYFKKQKQVQDAHEAIRVTDVSRTPVKMEPFLTKDQYKIYSLIWRRFVASQMKSGIDEQTKLEVTGTSNGKNYIFRYTSSHVKYAGFREVFPIGDEKEKFVPSFEEGQALKSGKLISTRKFTQPPPRYTEASLIRKMEEEGIGRPATYVPTIATLDKRSYIERKGRQLKASPLGRVINAVMAENFPDIVDLEFTAGMEKKLDEVENGNQDWREMLSVFYNPFAEEVKKAESSIEDKSFLIREPVGRKCPQCGNELLKKLGKNGYFIGCSNFVGGCRYTESIPLGVCPQCGGNVIRKKTKKGRDFFGCENYSTTGCDFSMMDKPAERTCPKCGSIMGQKVRKSGITMTCQNAECKYVMEETSEEENKNE